MECKSLDGDLFLSMLAFLTHKIFKSCVDMGWIFQILLQHREDNFETCDLLIYLHVDLKFHNLVLLPLNPDLKSGPTFQHFYWSCCQNMTFESTALVEV